MTGKEAVSADFDKPAASSEIPLVKIQASNSKDYHGYAPSIEEHKISARSSIDASRPASSAGWLPR